MKVFDNMVPRRILGPMMDVVTGGWRKQHNEELHNFYSSLNIISMIKSRSMTETGHLVRMGRKVMHTGYWRGSQMERDQWKDQGIRGWIILKWILEG
jgi:hypothetical protein